MQLPQQAPWRKTQMKIIVKYNRMTKLQEKTGTGMKGFVVVCTVCTTSMCLRRALYDTRHNAGFDLPVVLEFVKNQDTCDLCFVELPQYGMNELLFQMAGCYYRLEGEHALCS
jgi:hypothetical protein